MAIPELDLKKVNLQAAVGYLISLHDNEIDWNLLGIKVIGVISALPIPAGEYEYGDAYMVGIEPPYDMYIYTRPDGKVHTEGYWFPVGKFPMPGPQGPKGDGWETAQSLQDGAINNLTYDSTNGCITDSLGSITYKDSTNGQIKTKTFNMESRIPLVPGKYMSMDATDDNKNVEVKIDDSELSLDYYKINKTTSTSVPAYSPISGRIDKNFSFMETGNSLVSRGANGEARFNWILANSWNSSGSGKVIYFHDAARQLIDGGLVVNKTTSNTGTLTVAQLAYLQTLPQYQINYDTKVYYRMDTMNAPSGTLNYIHLDTVQEAEGGYKATGKCFSVDVSTREWQVIDIGFDGTGHVPVSEGTGTNSLIGNDTATNTAISENAASFGTGNIGGLKGYYWSNINLSAKTITLATSHTGGSPVTCGYAVGDVISIVNDAKYNNCSRITAIADDVITVDSFPFKTIEADEEAFDTYCIYCNAKPTIGTADLGKNAVVFGDNNKSGNRSSFVAGRDNAGVGQYGFAAGRGNTVAYACFAAGRNNNISHDYSCGIGWNNTSGGRVSTLIGYGNTGRGNYNFLIGASNNTTNNVTEQISIGFGNHSEAKTTFSIGKNNKHYLPNGIIVGTNNIGQGGVCLGDNNTVGENQYTVGKNNNDNFKAANVYRFGENLQPNPNQTIVGRYNKQVSSTYSFIVGIGTSYTDRKNGLCVTQSGDMLIGGSQLTLNANGTPVTITAEQLTRLLELLNSQA